MIRGFFPARNSEYYPWGEFDGLTVEPPVDLPERLTTILQALTRQQAFPVKLAEPESIEANSLSVIHRQDYLDFLASASSQAKTYILGMPSVFPIGPINIPKDVLGLEGQLGMYLFDTSTPIMGNTYSAAMNSAACALNAAECVLQGDDISLALCRPPGHHAGRAYGGGYCFLNNAALASAHLQSAVEQVALLDIDFHHGNGSQDIFYETNHVLYVSIHGHPETNYPFYWGFADERGRGAGKGFNYNFPLREGSSSTYLQTLQTALGKVAEYTPDALVLSAGFDTFRKDPLGEFKLRRNDFETIGKAISKLEVPTVVVLEGGYFYPQLGKNFLALIDGLLTK
ncbi:MAG: histone deacetylase family protein [Candidatus Hodarchaeales archaeon]